MHASLYSEYLTSNGGFLWDYKGKACGKSTGVLIEYSIKDNNGLNEAAYQQE